jgi:LuxR family transcriptional regulator, maltose regulon positive regulatory protein
MSGVLLPFLFFLAADLLEHHARVGTAHTSLVSDIRDLLSGGTPPAPGHAQPLLEPLSETGLRVLCYLPTNLPVPEIASELFVSTRSEHTPATCTTSSMFTRERRPSNGPASSV